MFGMKEKLQLVPRETALVLIDLENGIVGRKLAPMTGPDVVTRCKKLADAVRSAGGTVVYVHVLMHEMQPPPVDKPMMPPDAPPPPAVASELVWDCGYQAGVDTLIAKRQWDAFYGTNLHQILQGKGITTIVMAGIATNFGVESTARSAFAQGYAVVFAEDSMSSMSKDLHNFTVDNLFPMMGKVRTAMDVVDALQ